MIKGKRKYYVISFSSLTFAELEVITYSDLKVCKINGKECLLLYNERTKTDIPYKIPIVSPIVCNLLGQGKDFEKIFKPLGNQPTNRYLKDIMKEQGINKKMTFHRARHTFRTIVAKRGMNEAIAERIMGHAIGNDIKDIYTHLHDEDIIKEMLDKWVV